MNVENTSTEGVIDIKLEIEVKDEPYDNIKVENVSDNEADSERDLYTDHVIKDEMVVGPVVLQRQVVDVTYCPEDVPVPKKPKQETTDEETDQVKPEKGMKEDNTEGIISNVDFNKTNTTSRNTKQTNHKCNQTPGLSENVFTCNECGEQFQKKYKLAEHVTGHQKKFSCSHCDYKCKRKSHLSTHLLIHTGEKPYSCSHCNYKCNQKSRLSTHLRTHTGEKPFSCSHCDYKSKQKTDLSKHLRIHTSEKPYSCSHCDYKCKRNGDLTKHLLIHTGEKPYSCSQCDFKCKLKGNLSRHLRIHTSDHTADKPYSCSHCDYKCKQKCHLSAHSRIHTGEKP